MQIAWDETKRLQNLAENGLDFAALTEEFFEASTVYPARRGRFAAVGRFGDDAITVVSPGSALKPFRSSPATRQPEGKEGQMAKSRMKPVSDAREAAIQRQIAADPDSPELTDSQLRQGRSFAEAFPDLAEGIKRSRGRPRIERPKALVTLRVDPATIERFKAQGGNWRARMSKILEEAGS